MNIFLTPAAASTCASTCAAPALARWQRAAQPRPQVLAGAPGRVFASGNGVFGATCAPFNARPNDGQDDTRAIQAAIHARFAWGSGFLLELESQHLEGSDARPLQP